MKAAFVVSDDGGLIGRVAAAAGNGWAGCTLDWATERAVLLRDAESGEFLHLFVSPTRYDEDDLPFAPRPGVQLPDPRAVTSYLAECHSEQVFARVARSLAGLATGNTWVVDADAVWDARNVDPDAVQL